MTIDRKGNKGYGSDVSNFSESDSETVSDVEGEEHEDGVDDDKEGEEWDEEDKNTKKRCRRRKKEIKPAGRGGGDGWGRGKARTNADCSDIPEHALNTRMHKPHLFEYVNIRVGKGITFPASVVFIAAIQHRY